MPTYLAPALLSFFLYSFFMLAPSWWTMILSYFYALPLWYVGLRWGITPFKKSFTITITLALTTMLLRGSPVTALIFMLQGLIPLVITIFFFLFKRQNSYPFKQRDIIQINITLAFLLITLPHLFFIDTYKSLMVTIFTHQDAVQISTLNIDKITTFIPGLIGLIILALQSFIFKTCQNVLYFKKKAVRPEEVSLSSFVHTNWDIIAVSSFLISFIADYCGWITISVIAKSSLILSSYALLLQGSYLLSLLKRNVSWGAAAQYSVIFLIILLVWPAIFVVVLGAMEPWYHISRRFQQFGIKNKK